MNMPEDNSRMDELLKAYSRKCREQATAQEMHPATRRLLQGEVGRVHGKKREEEPVPPGFWLALWPRLALGAGFCVILASVIFWFGGKHSPHSSPATFAKNEAVEQDAPPQLSAAPASRPMEESALAPSLPQPVFEPKALADDRRETALEKYERMETAGLKKASPPSAPEATSHIVGHMAPAQDADLASGLRAETPQGQPMQTLTSNERVKTGEKFRAFAREEGQLAARVLADEAKAGMAQAAAKPVTLQQQFAQVDTRSQYRPNLQSPPQPKVLTEFEVTLMGDQIRVTDADGSVYDGALISPPAEAGAKPADRPALQKMKATEPEVGRTEPAGQPVIHFEVSGTNVRLNQQIVFSGSLVQQPQSAMTSNTPLSRDGAALQSAPARAASQRESRTGQGSMPTLQTRMQIQGTVLVGGTEQFGIEAEALPR